MIKAKLNAKPKPAPASGPTGRPRGCETPSLARVRHQAVRRCKHEYLKLEEE
jgi:hypothetical protein